MTGSYVVRVEDDQGRQVASTTHANESEARMEGAKRLYDPSNQGYTVWLVYPGGMEQELLPE